MSLQPIGCPGCEYGGAHLTTCPKAFRPLIPPTPGIYAPGSQVPVLVIGDEVRGGAPFAKAAAEVAAGEAKRMVIDQQLLPSSGTKLVCTTCGREDWHFLMLRRKAGLLEGLCKQSDGSGCYPLASRRSCQYTYPEQVDCPQLAEYCVAVGEQRLNPKQSCRDHIGEMMRQGPLYQVWPLED